MTAIAIVGEAWGAEEEKRRTPFVGYSGTFLTQMLRDAGINRADCFLTNVFNFHPPGNDLSVVLGGKSHAIPGYPPLSQSRYVHVKYTEEIERLGDELISCDPNIIIALGNTAMWALLGRTAISKFRGVVELSTHTATGFKVLPTYHPAAVVRQVDLRPTTILDFQKALRESAFPELQRPKREIWIEPTIEDLHEFRRHIKDRVSIDIETSGRYITCVGIGAAPTFALVIPFYDRRRTTRSFWPTPDDERAAWSFVREICEDVRIKKVFQNGLYDIAFLYRAMGIKTFGAEHDTMLLHHALQPEALKGLGYLGSIYTDEGAWKQMRERVTTIKKDE
jgi:uracil-DNA glycosylase